MQDGSNISVVYSTKQLNGSPHSVYFVRSGREQPPRPLACRAVYAQDFVPCQLRGAR